MNRTRIPASTITTAVAPNKAGYPSSVTKWRGQDGGEDLRGGVGDVDDAQIARPVFGGGQHLGDQGLVDGEVDAVAGAEQEGPHAGGS